MDSQTVFGVAFQRCAGRPQAIDGRPLASQRGDLEARVMPTGRPEGWLGPRSSTLGAFAHSCAIRTDDRDVGIRLTELFRAPVTEAELAEVVGERCQP